MTSIIVDWQQRAESEILETEENHFKMKSLPVCTKDGFSLEIEARMILQIDDESIIIKKFGSFPNFIENVLNVLNNNFFSYKERQDIVLNRLKIQKELAELLLEKLAEYNVKKIDIMMVSILMREYGIPRSTKSEVEKSIKEIHHFENMDNRCDKIYEVLKAMFSLLTILSILVSLIIIMMNFDHNTPVRLSTIVAIIVVIIGVREYFDIRKMMNTVK